MSNEAINKRIHTELFRKCWHDWANKVKSGRICKLCGKHSITADHEHDWSLNYSTDIAHAFKVVAEMERRGFHWELRKRASDYKMELWKLDNDAFFYSILMKTIPLTICDAVIKYLDNK